MLIYPRDGLTKNPPLSKVALTKVINEDHLAFSESDKLNQEKKNWGERKSAEVEPVDSFSCSDLGTRGLIVD